MKNSSVYFRSKNKQKLLFPLALLAVILSFLGTSALAQEQESDEATAIMGLAQKQQARIEKDGAKKPNIQNKSVYTLQDFGYGLVLAKQGGLEQYLRSESKNIGCFTADQLMIIKFTDGRKDLGIPAGAFSDNVLIKISDKEMLAIAPSPMPPGTLVNGDWITALLQFQRFAPKGSCLKIDGMPSGANVMFNEVRAKVFHAVTILYPKRNERASDAGDDSTTAVDRAD